MTNSNLVSLLLSRKAAFLWRIVWELGDNWIVAIKTGKVETITEEVATILEIVATIITKVATIVNLETNIFKNGLFD